MRSREAQNMANSLPHNHGPMGFASEVLREQNGLIVVQNDSEGFKHFTANEYDHAMEKQPGVATEGQRMLPDDTAHLSPTSRQRRKRFGWLALALATFCALAVGLGIGIGVGYASHVNQGTTTAGGGPSTVTLTASVPTSTSSGVVSGTTGIANLQCNSTVENNAYTAGATNYQGPSTFTEECYTDYQSGVSNFPNGTTVQVYDVNTATTYSFQSCMDNCVAFNKAKGSVSCRAVTYAANLTFAVQTHGANCWLKNTRGARHNDQGMDGWEYNLMASAYLNL